MFGPILWHVNTKKRVIIFFFPSLVLPCKTFSFFYACHIIHPLYFFLFFYFIFFRSYCLALALVLALPLTFLLIPIPPFSLIPGWHSFWVNGF
ncbi:hypothetical protein BCR41DRAFT_354296 [Lobosporangium transversale]|uniref:Uncharacterized protein n=1 Tax=Lobosporangium transversale TaxID=64571 RepID=A0A1Y2GP50_9FUNG|nr:hypothetical protein BCR41DRAFT_354296 [Lobosporangium transversale]ORZ14899.1 hypothetical protein BCR41DRAFT_354296 [Lobosporangium transversale]|eukprot:XP_021881031.1 hypothetical protein BCR41DRAFT_354296 [Lobosporangium transversale]